MALLKYFPHHHIIQGLTNYLTDLQFAAAEQDDLWGHLSVQGHKDGTQKRFLLGSSDDTKKRADETEYSWWNPLSFTSPGSSFDKTYNELWMEEGEQTKEVSDMPEEEAAVVFNVQQTGYYRFVQQE